MLGSSRTPALFITSLLVMWSRHEISKMVVRHRLRKTSNMLVMLAVFFVSQA